MRLALFLALLLASCTEAPQDGKKITLKLVKTTAEVARLCGDAGILEDFGCAKGSGATKDGSGDSCQIVALDVRTGFDDRERLATWGHELMHCFRGSVHE